ncbi:MAG: hydantoinase/oxoprolinase family protein [Methanomicrobiaceae archaeon]|nr:hydantoinase/oxoprolinase family protein [Methanomicrobiaceae archaeon]
MIGIDIGGANVKIATEEGVSIHYCPLWEHAPLPDILEPYAGQPAAVVMSGEQADSFASKEAGIAFIVGAVRATFPQALFYGMDGAFHTTAMPQLSAANWLVSADFLRTRHPGAVLVDMGSTTTDIIPLTDFDHLRGLSDLRRLQTGYLVYSGLLRTPVSSLVRSVAIDGTKTLVSSERFAIAADVHRALGHITEDRYTVPTPDNGERSGDASLQRLARMVCADLHEIGRDAALDIARQAWDAQKSQITSQVVRVMKTQGATSTLAAGIGSAVIAGAVGATDLGEELGIWSDAFPAFAVREVALRNAGRSP